ncbi:MAG: hypothetical protein B0A82_16965 [Alkalinema sp. CACIAM 70d]|nr:MAG: hypothetical protein B0A82_16965 [Alkalinema sp. CACIAM 70d]
MNLKKLLVFLVVPLLVIFLFVGSVTAQTNRQGLRKEALENLRLPNFTSIFNWGLKLSNIKDWYFFSGIAAQQPSFAVVAPGNYVVQTDYVLNELDIFLRQNALSRSDIVRIEFTLVSGYSEADFNTILGRFAGYFQNVKVKPAAGTLRVVNALAFPGLVVEYEVWCAK